MKQAPPIFALVGSPDGTRIVAGGSADGRVRVWETGGVREVGFSPSKRAAAYGLAFTPDGRALLVGSDRLHLVDLESGAAIRTFEGSRAISAIAGLAIDPTGAVACAPIGPAIRFWDVATGAELRTEDEFGWHVNHLRASGENVVTYAAESAHVLRVWNIVRGTLVRNLVTKSGAAGVSALGATPRWIAAASGPVIEVWPAGEAEPRFRLSSSATTVTSLAIDADDVLWARGGSSPLEAWSLVSGLRIATYEVDATHILPLADGRVLLADEDAGSLVWLARDSHRPAPPERTTAPATVRRPARAPARRATVAKAPAPSAESVLGALREAQPVATLLEVARRSRLAFPAARSPWLMDRRLVPALLRCLRGGDEPTTIAAANALAAITRGVLQPDPRAIPALTKALRHPHADVRLFAVSALGNLPHDAVDALSALLADRAKKIRLAALHAITHAPELPSGRKAKVVADAIAPLLADRVAAVRAGAAKALARLPEAMARPPLEAALSSERDPHAKLAMRRALGRRS